MFVREPSIVGIVDGMMSFLTWNSLYEVLKTILSKHQDYVNDAYQEHKYTSESYHSDYFNSEGVFLDTFTVIFCTNGTF